MSEKILYTWDQFDDDVRKICNSIVELGFKPDSVVGIARGGVVPATVISHIFNIPVHYVSWSYRDGKTQDYKTMSSMQHHAARGKKIIIIDDIVDSGKTISSIKDFAGDDFLYTTLWFNSAQNSTVNLYARVIDRSIDDRWIIMPWESKC